LLTFGVTRDGASIKLPKMNGDKIVGENMLVHNTLGMFSDGESMR
jgi:hypothetical protein